MSAKTARIALFLVAALVLPLAPAVAPAMYPPAGNDSFDSSAQVFVTPVPNCIATPLIIDEVLQGPTTIRRGTPVTPPDGRTEIPTEILSMSLTGQTITINESPDRPSPGKVKQQVAGRDFPADSFFDVNVDVSLNLLPQIVFVNLEPIRMQSVIHSLPPHVFPYLPPPGTCIPLGIKGVPVPVPVLWMIHAEHKPETNRFCAVGSGFGAVRDLTFPSFVGPFSFNAAFSVVHGTPSNNTLGDMIDMDLQGVWQGFQRPRNLVIDELAHTGSPGTMVGGPPQIQSFFDVFHDVSLDGVTQSGTGRLRLQGTLNPNPGGANTLQLVPPPSPVGPIQIEMLQIQATTVPCTTPYPPVDL